MLALSERAATLRASWIAPRETISFATAKRQAKDIPAKNSLPI